MNTDEPGTNRTAPADPGWRQLRPLLLRLHFYAGVLVAPFLVVATLTGLLYVFTPQLEQLLYEEQLHVPPAAVTQPLSDQVATARAAMPGTELRAVRPAPTPTDTTQVIFEAPDLPESHYRTVFIDPHTAEIRGILHTYGSSQALPMRAWIDNLHRQLLLGEPGRIYSELAASWLWVIVLGGLVLWLSRRRPDRRSLLLPKLRDRGRRRTLSWHGALGLWAAIGLLFLSATGLSWSLYAGQNISALRAALNWETPTVNTELPHRSTADIGIDRVHQIALEHGLSGPVEITPPEDGSAYQVQQVQRSWPTKQDAIAVDPATGEITETLRFADYPLMAKLTRWGIDAHMGLLFGLPNQLLLAALGIALLLLIFWGYRMWWQRRPDGLGRPPARGTWRRVPGRVLAPVIAAAVLIAHALPVFGVSLLLFLAIDGVLGWLHRRRAQLTTGG